MASLGSSVKGSGNLRRAIPAVWPLAAAEPPAAAAADSVVVFIGSESSWLISNWVLSLVIDLSLSSRLALELSSSFLSRKLVLNTARFPKVVCDWYWLFDRHW